MEVKSTLIMTAKRTCIIVNISVVTSKGFPYSLGLELILVYRQSAHR